MYPCNKCLENSWSFDKIEGIVKATCNLCGNEVEFEPKKKSKPFYGKKKNKKFSYKPLLSIK